LRETLPLDSPTSQGGQFELTVSYRQLLPVYPARILSLVQNETHQFLEPGVADDDIAELQLFLRGFLLERSIFESFAFENRYEAGILTADQWRDMQYRSARQELDDLDEWVDTCSESESPFPNGDPQPRLPLPSSIRPELRVAIKQRGHRAVSSVLADNSGVVDASTLTLAIYIFDLAIFSLLLAHGAMVNGDELHVWTEPLYVASKTGNLAAVKLLRRYGAGVEGGSTIISATPLTGASSGGHLGVVQYLISKGPNVNGNKYKSPLSRALKHGHTEIARYLILHGADLNEPVPDSGSDPPI
jgi:hypothetical protein